MSEPYLITRIGPKGPDERGARYILGPPLGPSYSELRRQLEQARERLDNESALRVQAQDRLNRAMRVLASLGRLSPRMADLVATARKDIWR